MGSCVSTPNAAVSEKALDAAKEQRLSDYGSRSGSLDKAIAPVRVFRDEEVSYINIMVLIISRKMIPQLRCTPSSLVAFPFSYLYTGDGHSSETNKERSNHL